jgi:alkanesulfonate monooxygenase SsuD/methylene tetrahydromethanopterin reductase-like flavin-dependent oxidoreductase (luciferase family)
MLLTIRYDFRAPSFGAPSRVLYATAIEQTVWADQLGFDEVHFPEKHGADDGYSSTPMMIGAAVASRTTNIRIWLSALVAALHDPIRLAEDLAILDVISGGRLGVTLGLGYRQSEFSMFGVDKRRRVPLLAETFQILEQAWTGEPFTYRGHDVVIRPTPIQKPRPPLFIGGMTEASARRAARYGDGYIPAAVDPGLFQIYEQECRRLGRTPGPPIPNRGPMFLHVSDDPERDWPIVAPHVQYASNANAAFAAERTGGVQTYPAITGLDDLKKNKMLMVVTPDQCVALAQSLGAHSEITLQPLMGGLDPEVSWASLQLFEQKVLPRLTELGMR